MLFSSGTKKVLCPSSQKAVGKIVLLGNPNVGKSVIFNRLTESYGVVSNYPGTTVDIFRGEMRIGERIFELIDTPGMYSFSVITEEERVTRRILLEERFDLVLHVADAKNIERMLGLSLQIVEAGFPVFLILNMMDEAEAFGKRIDLSALEERIKIPVIPMASIKGEGFDLLRDKIKEYIRRSKDV